MLKSRRRVGNAALGVPWNLMGVGYIANVKRNVNKPGVGVGDGLARPAYITQTLGGC